MKLKTKFQDEDFELGEVTDADVATMPDGRIKLQAKAKDGGLHTIFYDKLEKLYSEWEDYEEPKGYWYIDLSCNDIVIYEDLCLSEEVSEKLKQIGNYFKTKEEAEKAVEKLTAWERLKDKGFRLEGWTIDDGLRISICTNFDSDGIYDEYRKEVKNDLDICFGGEE